MSLPDSLRRFRKEFNLTQKAVADAVGMKESVYQRYEHGTREPAYKQLVALADFLFGDYHKTPSENFSKA